VLGGDVAGEVGGGEVDGGEVGGGEVAGGSVIGGAMAGAGAPDVPAPAPDGTDDIGEVVVDEDEALVEDGVATNHVPATP
jgi:hypothetical protein